MEVPPKSLSPESSLLATFTTKNSSGIILAALGKDVEKAGWSQAHVVSSCDPQKEMSSRNMHGKCPTKVHCSCFRKVIHECFLI